jgi:hypothetical protein
LPSANSTIERNYPKTKIFQNEQLDASKLFPSPPAEAEQQFILPKEPPFVLPIEPPIVEKKFPQTPRIEQEEHDAIIQSPSILSPSLLVQRRIPRKPSMINQLIAIPKAATSIHSSFDSIDEAVESREPSDIREAYGETEALTYTMVGSWFQKYNRYGSKPQLRFVWVFPLSNQSG